MKAKIYEKEKDKITSMNIQDLVTGKERLSYVHLINRYSSQLGGEVKYSTIILLPKTDLRTKQRILNATEKNSGIYARVSAGFSPYASNGKKGIGCGLGPVQKIEDGESMGGGGKR